MAVFNNYLDNVETALRRGDATEHTHRPVLKTLIESLASGITATNEPKAIKCGAPDYIVTRAAIPLGYIEAKDVGKDLSRIEKDEQLKRYREGLPNLVLTDYLEFRWYVAGEHRLTARLAEADGSGKLRRDADGAGEVQALLRAFIDARIPTVRSPRELASRMAGIARLAREAIRVTFAAEDKSGTLHTQFDAFRKVLIETLTAEQFADMYAQTLAYGLFAARCNHDGAEPFTRQRAAWDMPKTNPFLREIFQYMAGPSLDERIAWAVDDLAELLNRADIKRILRNFGQRTRRTDPVLHFYETFLAEYDPKLREARGVYYTPEPVVSYIVRSVDHILKTDFDLPDGLADTATVKLSGRDAGRTAAPRVLVLDPAVGTGTFLHEVIDHIHEHEQKKGRGGAWNGYVNRHLLPRLFGFEFLMAPYTICHMKLGLQLAETGYEFRDNERLKVYLTNTLEEAHALAGLPLFHQMLGREALEAGHVKQEHPVMVVLGNPPYSGHSANKGTWISGLLRGRDEVTGQKTANYFEVDSKPLGERNPKWLNDDYVKFIRFAQWRIERTGYGILAFITNHGYLDNPTFRGMRQSLMEAFDDIYVLDLHGNYKKKERAPDGSKDENVFDIQQGVAIGIFVKKKGSRRKLAKVFHSELWGLREVYEGSGEIRRLVGGKYRWLWDNYGASTKWAKLSPEAPHFLFRPQDVTLSNEYESGWQCTDIFPMNSVGIATGRDAFAIDFDREKLLSRIREFSSLDIGDVEAKARFLSNRDKLPVEKVRKELRDLNLAKQIYPCLYRPFDIRFLFYSDIILERSRRNIMRHLLCVENIALITSRLNKGEKFAHTQVTKTITEVICMSPKTSNNGFLFPLYLYPTDRSDLFDTSHEASHAPSGRRANLSPEFVSDLKAKLGMEFLPDGKGDRCGTFGPEDVFGWIYAVLHSPTYRERYAEFLKIDFPRVPLTVKADLFRALCAHGDELIALHLMQKVGPGPAAFPVSGTDEVEKVRYSEPSADSPGRVWINKEQFFEGVPPEVWEFLIGGYRVAEKWLKDRKGRVLDYDDIRHYQNIVAALAETVRLMAEIDKAIEAHGGWPVK